MKHQIQQLAAISRQKSRHIVGLMSGTSLDGLDVAYTRFEGSGLRTRVTLLAFESRPYPESFQAEIRRVFARKTIEFQDLVLLNVRLANHHAATVLDCLNRWNVSPSQVDLLASHGQTVFHAPRRFHGLPDFPNATLQIGDGDHLARRTGIITLSDFRQKHVAAGGEGAPLALYGDYFLFSKRGEDRVLLNLGGIANFTFLPGSGDAARVMATDTGPANTLIDHAARLHFGVPFDRDALLALNGRTDEWLLERLRSEPFFAQPFPKTTGPEQFGPAWLDAALKEYPKGSVNPYDLVHTLTRLSVSEVARAVRRLPRTARRGGLYVSGGGAHNPLMMRLLQEELPNWNIQKMEILGLPGDAKEAVLFALLANETVAGTTRPGAMLGGLPLISMGKISFP
jgi:anhydro-N-acetylmuramic acid kinase